MIELKDDSAQRLIVAVEPDPSFPDGGYYLTASTTLHQGDLAYKSQLMVELAVYRCGARNLPLEATMRRSPEECWVYWPGPRPTVELVNAALHQVQAEPPVVQVHEYPLLPGCLLLRSSDRIGEFMHWFIWQAAGVERASRLGDSPLRGSHIYDERKTLIITTDVRSTAGQAIASIRKALAF